jgi:hypothetical protein
MVRHYGIALEPHRIDSAGRARVPYPCPLETVVIYLLGYTENKDL